MTVRGRCPNTAKCCSCTEKSRRRIFVKVCVIGAGVSGCCAAIQAARSGAECLLIEKSGIPGGTLSMGGVSIPGLFHAWNGKQVISGIGWELVKESVDIAGGTMPDFNSFDMNYFWHYQVPVNAVVFTALCDSKFKESNVDVRYHTMVGKVEKLDSGWEVTLCGKDGLYTEKTDFIIDCTGDADVVKMAGFPVSSPDVCQPGTYSVRCTGYEVEKVDWDQLRAAFNAAWEKGEIFPEDIGWSKGFSWLFVQRKGENANHIHCSNLPGWRNQMEISGRESLLRACKFLKKQPGFENLDMHYVGMECGVRESRTIIGETTVSEADFLAGKNYPDAVCYGFYPVDLHDDKEGIIKTLLQPEIVPTVPRGALIPRASRGLLAAGRIISSDRMANSGLRIQATCMATGQAAGALAALCCKHNVSAQELDNSLLRAELIKHKAILPPEI